MKLSVYTNDINDNLEIKSLLLKEIKDSGFSIDDNNPDVVIFVGGDGTFLRAVHQYLSIIDSVKLIGVNTGSLGFLVDIKKENYKDVISLLKSKEYLEQSHSLIECHVNNNKIIFAINEVRLENPFHTLICNIFINNENVEAFRGNGLVVSSELGSSAYNKSLGGALVDHKLNVLQLAEIAPISNNVYRSIGSPLVLSSGNVIKFEGDISECVIGYDHLVDRETNLKSLTIKKSEKKITVLYPKEHSYIQSIKRSFTK